MCWPASFEGPYPGLSLSEGEKRKWDVSGYPSLPAAWQSASGFFQLDTDEVVGSRAARRGQKHCHPGLLPEGRNKPLLLSTVGLVSPAEHVSLPSQDSLPAVSLPLRTGIASHAHSGLTQSAPLMQILTQIPESSTQNGTPKPCPRSSCAMKYNTLELS